jgi:hypothetical protein
MSGKLQEKTLSVNSQTENLLKVLEILLLVGIGVLAIALRGRLRMGMNLPGHHGIYFMALLLLARRNAKGSIATTWSALGIGTMLLFPVLGFRDPLQAFVYVLPGIVLDLIFLFSPEKLRKNAFYLAMAAGVAWMSIPLTRLGIVLITGIPYDSFMKHGYLYPQFAWFMSGSIGGFAAMGIQILGNKILKNSK